MVGVVEQDHVAGAERPRSAPSDPLGSGEAAPVLAPARPQERFEPGIARGVEPGARVDAERRPVEARMATDDADRAGEVVANGGGERRV